MELRGARQVETNKILDGLATHQTGWWPFATRRWFDPAALDEDLERVLSLYAANGFFRAQVDHRVSEHNDGESVRVVFSVREGQATHLRQVSTRGLESVPEPQRSRVRGQLKLAPGQRFDYQRYLNSKADMRHVLTSVGYPYSVVRGALEVDRDKHQAGATLQLKPGPLVHFGKLRVQGNGPIPAEKLLRMAYWSPGDRFDPARLARTKARLLNTRVFSLVRLEIPRSPTPVADVTMKVEPTKLRELRLGGGVGMDTKRWEARLRATWIWRNFLGGLRTLSADLKPALVTLPNPWESIRIGPAIKSEVRLRQPDAFSTKINASAAVSYELGLHEGYRFHGPGTRLGLDRPFFDEKLSIGISWNLQYFDFFDFSEDTWGKSSTQLGLSFVDPYRLTWLEQSIALDLRDSAQDPRAGFYAQLHVEEGFPQIGSDFAYIKVKPEARGFIPLGTKRLVLGLRAQWGQIWTFDSDDSPVTRRLYLGGPTRHRGFAFNRLSPQIWDKDEKDFVPLGGNSEVLFSADLRLRTFKLWGSWLNLVAFFDAGDVVSKLDQLDLEQLHLAVGGSLSYQTPIGAIRMALGVRLNRLDPTADDGRQNADPKDQVTFHLTIGEAF